MGVGGATWDTAGPLDLSDNNYFDQDDAVPPDFGLTDEGWFVFTPASHLQVRIRTGDPANNGFLVFIIPDGADDPGYPENLVDDKGYDGTGTIFWFQKGVTYHIALGNFSFLTSQTYQVIIDQVTPLAVTGWYDDLKNRTDNILEANTGEFALGVGSTRSRNATYGITRELDSPEMAGMDCGWDHAIVGHSDVIIWEGFCPVVPSGGLVASSEPTTPYADGDFDVTHGGSAQEILWGGAIFAHEVHDEMPPNGVLDVPPPLAHGLDLDDWFIEFEDEFTMIRGIEFAADDLPPLDPEDPSYPPVDVGITYRDEHLPEPPPKIVPVNFNTDTGQYDSWPIGPLSEDIELGTGGPEWTTLYGSMTGPATDWSYFYFPAEGETYAPGDYVFGARMLHLSPDTGPEIERPSFILRANFSLQASRYRYVYKGATSTPPRRIFGRSDGATHGAARTLGGGNTVQSGRRVLGGIL